MYLFGLWSTAQNQLVGSDDPGRIFRHFPQQSASNPSRNSQLRVLIGALSLLTAHTSTPRVWSHVNRHDGQSVCVHSNMDWTSWCLLALDVTVLEKQQVPHQIAPILALQMDLMTLTQQASHPMPQRTQMNTHHSHPRKWLAGCLNDVIDVLKCNGSWRHHTCSSLQPTSSSTGRFHEFHHSCKWRWGIKPMTCCTPSMTSAVMKAAPRKIWMKERTIGPEEWERAIWPWSTCRAQWPCSYMGVQVAHLHLQMVHGLDLLSWRHGLCFWLDTHGTWCALARTSSMFRCRCFLRRWTRLQNHRWLMNIPVLRVWWLGHWFEFVDVWSAQLKLET